MNLKIMPHACKFNRTSGFKDKIVSFFSLPLITYFIALENFFLLQKYLVGSLQLL